jgi:hypothetical protein
MGRRLGALGAPVPRYSSVSHLDEVDAFAARIGGPIVVQGSAGVTTAAASICPPMWPAPATSWPGC